MGRDLVSSKLGVRHSNEARLLTPAGMSDFQETDLKDVKTFLVVANPRDGGPQGHMVVINRGPHGSGYVWCHWCEYAESVLSRVSRFGRSDVEALHDNPRTGERCPISHLKNPIDWGHLFETDVRILYFRRELPEFDNLAPEIDSDLVREGFKRTLSEAIRLAATSLLETASRDLRSTFETRNGRLFVVLSDVISGGAGYCRRLARDPGDPRFSASKIVAQAIEILDCSNKECVLSCTRYLNEYSNQIFWDSFGRIPCLEWLSHL